MEKSTDLTKFLSEIKRMGGLEYPPSTTEAWTELARRLRKSAATQEHAERIVTRWIDTHSGFPRPNELETFAEAVPKNPAFDRPDLPAPCAICDPRSETNRCADQDGLFVLAENGVGRCACDRGRKLKHLDQQRFEETKRRDRENGGGFMSASTAARAGE